VTPSICGVSGTTVTPLTSGRCFIKASATGNATYAAATLTVGTDIGRRTD
jgi:hypothetical protein